MATKIKINQKYIYIGVTVVIILAVLFSVLSGSRTGKFTGSSDGYVLSNGQWFLPVPYPSEPHTYLQWDGSRYILAPQPPSAPTIPEESWTWDFSQRKWVTTCIPPRFCGLPELPAGQVYVFKNGAWIAAPASSGSPPPQPFWDGTNWILIPNQPSTTPPSGEVWAWDVGLGQWVTSLPPSATPITTPTQVQYVYSGGIWIPVSAPTSSAPAPDVTNNKIPVWSGSEWVMVQMPTSIPVWTGTSWAIGNPPPINSYPPSNAPSGMVYNWNGNEWVLADMSAMQAAGQPPMSVYDFKAGVWAIVPVQPLVQQGGAACTYDTGVFKAGAFVQGTDPAGFLTPRFMVTTYAPPSVVCDPLDHSCLKFSSIQPIKLIGLQLQHIPDDVYSQSCGYDVLFPQTAVPVCQLLNFPVGENVKPCECQNPPNLQGPAPFPGIIWVPPNAPGAPQLCDATRCVANAACDRRIAGDTIPFCAKGGVTAIHDRCSSMCQPEDRPDMTCRRVGISDCTGDAPCDGIVANTNFCDANCKVVCQGKTLNNLCSDFCGSSPPCTGLNPNTIGCNDCNFIGTIVEPPSWPYPGHGTYRIYAWGYSGWGDCSTQSGGFAHANTYCKCQGFTGAVSCYHEIASHRSIWRFDIGEVGIACTSSEGGSTVGGLAFTKVACY